MDAPDLDRALIATLLNLGGEAQNGPIGGIIGARPSVFFFSGGVKYESVVICLWLKSPLLREFLDIYIGNCTDTAS